MTESNVRPGNSTGTLEARSGTSSGTQEHPGVPDGTQKTRRSGRISQSVSILLIGSDAEGRVFTEATYTVVLSLHGAGNVSIHKLMPEQELILRIAATDRETEVRVVGQIAEEGGVYTYGVAFLNERLNFWEMGFPPPPEWDDRPPVLTLECSGCRNLVDLLNGDFEYDICRIHGGLARFCAECGTMTVWKQPDDLTRLHPEKEARRKRAVLGITAAEAGPEKGVPLEETPVEPVVEALLQSIAVPAKAEEVERRERVRAKVSFLACVRTLMFGADVVPCIDMSRGGVSFRSKNAYTPGMKIEIAVPFSAEAKAAPTIFVKGRIANVRPVEGGMWRCGVEFVS